jgi:hypothetical protein
MKVELAANRMSCDEASLQQTNESLLKEKSDLLAMQVSLLAQEKASLLAQLHSFTAPISPAFMPPPGLAFSPHQKHYKNADHDSDRASTCSGSAESSDSDCDSSGTTVVVRNIPNRFSHENLASVLDAQGFSGAYDLIYVPLDFSTGVSFGYAFVNLTCVDEAERFVASFDGFKWGGGSKKVCSVARCEDGESPNERVERYRNLPVMHPSMPDSFKPAMYSGGARMPFPAPTRKLCAPKVSPGKKR